MAVCNLPKFVTPASTATLPPSDVTFVFKNNEKVNVGVVKAHKVILGFASDVFYKEFFGNLKSEDIVEVKDSRKEVFEVFIAFIYGKHQSWKNYDLEMIASLYNLSDKYNVRILGKKLISYISELKVDKDCALEVATLAQESILLQELSHALFLCATRCLKEEFGSESEKIYDFCTDQPGINESHALVVFKMLTLMKMVPNPPNLVCLNCKMSKKECLDGVGITSANFVPGANVTPIINQGRDDVVKLVRAVGLARQRFVGITRDGSEVGNLSVRPEYYKYNCLSVELFSSREARIIDIKFEES